MQINKRFWRRNKAKVIFSGLAVASLAFNYGDISKNMAAVGQLRSQIATDNAYTLSLEEKEESRKQQAAIADARLKRGCTPVVDSNAITKDEKGRTVFNLAPLQPGKPVNDRGNLTKLVPGTCVVGAFGDTAIIQQDWTAGEVAVGGDKILVDRNINAIAGRSAAVYRITPTIK